MWVEFGYKFLDVSLCQSLFLCNPTQDVLKQETVNMVSTLGSLVFLMALVSPILAGLTTLEEKELLDAHNAYRGAASSSSMTAMVSTMLIQYTSPL